jgi:integrase
MSREKVPYLCWRHGRPRWVPSPELRAKGFKGQDLKDEAGHWLPRGAAIDAAEKLNATIKSPNLSSPAAFISPRIAGGSGRAAAEGGKSDPQSRTMATLFTAYETSPHFTRRLKKGTRDGYGYHIAALREWCGDVPITGLTKPAIAEFHAALEENSGAAWANAVLRTLKIVFNYAIEDRDWLTRNPCRNVDFAATTGRLVLWTTEEIRAFTAAADALELPSMGDAVILAVLTGQRQGDVIALRDVSFSSPASRGEVAQSAEGGKSDPPTLMVFRTGKTGAMIKLQAADALKARIETARKRKAETWPNVKHTAEIVCELTGAPYHAGGSRFRALFRMVRAVAAGAEDAAKRVHDELGPARAARLGNVLPTLATCPSVAGKWFLDLRDTAVTWLFMAGCTVAEIATITGHSLRTVQDILDKHYFVRTDAMAQSAAKKFNTFLAGQKW